MYSDIITIAKDIPAGLMQIAAKHGDESGDIGYRTRPSYLRQFYENAIQAGWARPIDTVVNLLPQKLFDLKKSDQAEMHVMIFTTKLMLKNLLVQESQSTHYQDVVVQS
jgi:hypothetical protein